MSQIIEEINLYTIDNVQYSNYDINKSEIEYLIYDIVYQTYILNAKLIKIF